MRELTLPADVTYIKIPPLGGIICREGQLTHLFFPGRVGRGYGSEWTLVVVVVVSPALMGLKVQNLNTKTPLGARKGLAPSLKVQNLNTKTPLGARRGLAPSLKVQNLNTKTPLGERKGLAPSLNLGPEVVIHTPS